MDVKVKHGCGAWIKPTTYCLPSHMAVYLWQWLHVYPRCKRESCAHPDIGRKWHGIRTDGLLGTLCDIAKNSKDERLWMERLNLHLKGQDSGTTASQATLEISRDLSHGDNAVKAIQRMQRKIVA